MLRKAFEGAFENTVLVFYIWYRYSTLLTEGFRQAFAGFEAVIRRDYEKLLDKENGEEFERETGEKLVHDYKLITKRHIVSAIVDIVNAINKQSVMEETNDS